MNSHQNLYQKHIPQNQFSIKNYLELIQHVQKDYSDFNAIKNPLILFRKWLTRYQSNSTDNDLKKEGFYLFFYLFSVLVTYLKFFRENPIYGPYFIRYSKLFDLLFKDTLFLKHLSHTIQKDYCIQLKLDTIHHYLKKDKR